MLTLFALYNKKINGLFYIIDKIWNIKLSLAYFFPIYKQMDQQKIN